MSQPLDATQLDPLLSPVLHQELPGLRTAFDGEAMRDRLQAALLGGSGARFRIARCEPGDAGYFPDGTCLLRYELELEDGAVGAPIRALVSARISRDRLACAAYLRDKLAPLAALMRGRREVAPFATPAAMIEPLNMAVHVFPLDGELPTLVAATDPERMAGILGATLPEAVAGALEVEACDVELVDYARRLRAVLRYQIRCRRPGTGRGERRTVYGKVFGDDGGALAVPVTAALRERLENGPGSHRIDIPRSYGWRPELRLSLLEAIPGEPAIAGTLKARLRGTPAMHAAPSLEEMMAACGRTAALLHTSGIALGPRRALADELAALWADLAPIRRATPALAARLQSWLEGLETHAARSDPLRPCFNHGDFTRGQLIFDGARAGLVDFDSVCQAEPALDLGQFLAYLRLADKGKDESLRSGELLGQIGSRFMEAYVSAAGDRLGDLAGLRVRVAIYKIASLLRRAMRSWQKLKPRRIESALATLEEEAASLPWLR